jgi:alpha-2-macroglobulin
MTNEPTDAEEAAGEATEASSTDGPPASAGLRDRLRAQPRLLAGIAGGAVVAVLVLLMGIMVLLGGDEVTPASEAVTITPSGDQAPRLGPILISFAEVPAASDPQRLVLLEPAVPGAFAWLDERTLLFQPDFPGLQRGAQYRVRVDGATAGIGQDVVQAFTVEGKLTVRSVIPGPGDSDVPSEAQIYVQFSRAVAPLTLLSESTAAPVLTFEPALSGRGTWLNTSLYVFTPDDLRPSTSYRATVAAGLTSAADGVLEADYSWEFATYQPALANAVPADGTSFVAPDQVVRLTFNQPMDRAGVESALRMRERGGDEIAFTTAWSDEGRTVTLTPAQPFAIASTYEVSIPAGLAGETGGQTQAARSISFNTVETPRLVSSSPSDGESNAGRWGIYLQFNNPMDIDSLEEHITISGIARERWTLFDDGDGRGWHINTMLQPSTSYTVTVADGVVDRAGLPLGPVTIRFTTGQLQPQVSYAVPGQFVTYSAEGAQELFFYAINQTSVQFDLFELSPELGRRLVRTNEIPSPGIPTWTPDSPPVDSWTVQVPEARDASVLASTTLGNGRQLPRGFYYLRTADGAGWNAGIIFAVVDTTIVTKLSFDELLVWALDYETGVPVANLDIAVSGGGIGDATIRTNAQGIATVGVPRPSTYTGNEVREFTVTSSQGGRFAVGRTDWAAGTEPWLLGVPLAYWDQELVGHVYTDRPIYRSGEEVFFKATVRHDDDATFRLPEMGDTGLQVVVNDAQGDEIYREPLVANSFGTFGGSLFLPAEASTGFYSVSIRDTSRGWENWLAGSTFQVAEFRVPEFRVELLPDREDVVDGEQVGIDLEASFFFGGALEGAAVEWNAYGYQAFVSFPGYERYSFGEFDWFQPAIMDDPLRASGSAVTGRMASPASASPAHCVRTNRRPGSRSAPVSRTSPGRSLARAPW